MTACGLDFGTSNTTLGLAAADGPRLLPLEGEALTIPSAVFFAPDGTASIGRAATASYVEGLPGRLMRSLKSVLGKPLADETTPVGRRRVTFRDVIGQYLAAVKARAEAAAGETFDCVVHGRPVHFVDGDPGADRRAEDTLRAIAHGIGFRHVEFAFEPIAAALDHERTLVREEIALIADIGGGTSDFSLVRLGPGRRDRPDRTADILANGGVRIGGVDMDRVLSLARIMPELGYRSPARRPGLDVPSSYFHDLATWASINRLYTPAIRRELEEVRRDAARPDLIERLIAVVAAERGHTLAMEAEEAKITLAGNEAVDVPLGWIEEGLAVPIDRAGLAGATASLTARLRAAVETCLASAGVAADAVDAVVLTGGSTRLAPVRDAIRAALPSARTVEADTFGSVGTGLALMAARTFGPGRGARAA